MTPERTTDGPIVDYQEKDHIAIVTINRPEARNAVNGEVAQGIETALDRVEESEHIWVAILTGAGPVFSAGADLKAISTGQVAQIQTAKGGFAGLVRRERTKPLIAAVDGPALAGGCEIVLACDLVVASRAARFGIPEVKRALVAAAGGLFRLPRALPRNVAMEMALTGEPITAEKAYNFGLVNELVEEGGALDAAMALAMRICVNAPLAVRESRAVVLASETASDDELWSMSAAAMAKMAGTEDFLEGPRAFLEKREPVWKGR
jgi:enoyl-CoA hydratase